MSNKKVQLKVILIPTVHSLSEIMLMPGKISGLTR